jgi:hypothetical protein
MGDADVAAWETGVGAWEWTPDVQLERLWARCRAEAQRPPFAPEPPTADTAIAAAGLSYYAAAFYRSGDLVEGPRQRHFHKAGAAARVCVRVRSSSPWTGALRPGAELHGLLRLSSVFGAQDDHWAAPDGPLPVLGAALKLPVYRAPSLNLLLLQSPDGAVRTLDGALGVPLATALPSAASAANLSAPQRFAAAENEARSAAALRAIEAPAAQRPTRLSVERWCALHPSGARSPGAPSPWALRLRLRAEALRRLRASTAADLRERLWQTTWRARPEATTAWATLDWCAEGGPWKPLADIALQTRFLVSPVISAQLQFQHLVGEQ